MPAPRQNKPTISFRTVVRKNEARDLTFEYKDVELLSRFLTEHGSIMPRERTGLSNKQQRQLALAIKRARHIALLPYVTTL